MGIFYRFGKAAVDTGAAGFNVVEGGVKIVGGVAGTAVGAVADPVLRAGGGVGFGALDRIQEVSGLELVSDEQLDTLKEHSKNRGFNTDNWLVEAGRDTATSGGLDLFQAGHYLGSAKDQLLSPEDAPHHTEQIKGISQAQDRLTNPVSAAVDIVGPGKLRRTVTLLGVAMDSHDLIRKHGGDPESIEDMAAYNRALTEAMTKERRAADRAATDETVRKVRGHMTRVDDPAESISATTAKHWASVLAGPDGWSAFGQSDKGIKAMRDAQAGRVSEVQSSWNEWRALGGKWRGES